MIYCYSKHNIYSCNSLHTNGYIQHSGNFIYYTDLVLLIKSYMGKEGCIVELRYAQSRCVLYIYPNFELHMKVLLIDNSPLYCERNAHLHQLVECEPVPGLYYFHQGELLFISQISQDEVDKYKSIHQELIATFDRDAATDFLSTLNNRCHQIFGITEKIAIDMPPISVVKSAK